MLGNSMAQGVLYFGIWYRLLIKQELEATQCALLIVYFIPCNTKDLLILTATLRSKHYFPVHLASILPCLLQGKSMTHFK